MSVVVKIDLTRLNELRAELKPRAQEILAESAFNIQGGAQSRAPVDTGALRSSIMAEQVGELAWQIHDGVEYGIFQELGTSRMAAQPFMVPAVEAERANFVAAWAGLFI